MISTGICELPQDHIRIVHGAGVNHEIPRKVTAPPFVQIAGHSSFPGVTTDFAGNPRSQEFLPLEPMNEDPAIERSLHAQAYIFS
jgi:hypothetical protein